MKTLMVLILSLTATQFAESAEEVKIMPAHAFPDYEKVRLATAAATRHFDPFLEIGDFNKDQRLDAAIVDHEEGLPFLAVILLQNAEGTFVRQSETYELPITSVVRGFVLHDVNEDGNPDLLLIDKHTRAASGW